MRIRPAQPEDRPEWIRLLSELYPHHPEADHSAAVHAFFTGTGDRRLLPGAVFVCERAGGGLSGFLELSLRNYAEGCAGPTPYVESWFVDADLRSEGIGRALMEAAEAWARERRFTELASDAELENLGSQRAHQAVGFSEVQRAVHFRKAL